MATRGSRYATKVPEEPVVEVEEAEEPNILDTIEVTEADIAENEAISAEAQFGDDEPEKVEEPEIFEETTRLVDNSDESLLAEGSSSRVTYKGLKVEGSVPSVIQIIIPLDGTPADDPTAVIDYGDFLQFKLQEPKEVTPEQAAWLKNHLTYEIS